MYVCLHYFTFHPFSFCNFSFCFKFCPNSKSTKIVLCPVNYFKVWRLFLKEKLTEFYALACQVATLDGDILSLISPEDFFLSSFLSLPLLFDLSSFAVKEKETEKYGEKGKKWKKLI